MKKTSIAVLSLLLISGTTTFGQGTLFFANRLSASTFSVVYEPDGTTPLNAGYSAQLFANTSGTFNPVGTVVTFRTGGGQGSWAGVTDTIPGAIAGTSVQLQVYAWFNNKLLIVVELKKYHEFFGLNIKCFVQCMIYKSK